MRTKYWRFYWPLAVTGVTSILASQFQNGALARYPDASRELALFAYAYGLFWLFRAALVFVPQMSNLLARSPQAHRVCFSFVATVSLLLALPLAAMGATASGARLVSWMFEIEGENLDRVLRYLRFFAPLVLVDGLRQYGLGLLIQRRSTRTVTLLNLVEIGATLLILGLGYRRGVAAASTLIAAQWGSFGIHLLLLALALVYLYRTPSDRGESLTYAEANRFFWPVAVTSLMFAVSRPILYGFVSRGPEAVARVAALRVAFDFALLFHQPLNQFRNLFATFGTADLAGLRRFQLEVVLAMTAAMVGVSFTSLDTVLFESALGLEGEVLALAEEALRILCLLPLAVGFRNYFHGIALARLTTGGMAYAAVLRVLAIYAATWLAVALGALDHVRAAAILVLGFGVEALLARFFVGRRL